jgi:hypothetical protein
MAKEASLVHPRETLKVSAGTLVPKCQVSADDPTLVAVLYWLKLSVSVADFRLFASALEGDAVDIANDNIGGLSLLCDEFGFEELAVELSEFRQSPTFKETPATEDAEARLQLSALEELAVEQDRALA